MPTVERIKEVFGEALHNLNMVQRHRFFEDFVSDPEYSASGVSCRRISYHQLKNIDKDKCFSIACHERKR